MKQLGENNKPILVRSVRTLILSTGFGEAWYNQGVGDCEVFLQLFKTRLSDNFTQDWHARLAQSSRARFYRAIKERYTFSLYLDVVLPKQHRMALTRLVASSHSLKCETGRWTRPVTPSDERRCFNCNNKVEDEYHFLLECPVYEETRNRLIPRYYRIRPSMFKLQLLFNTTSPRILKGLAKYVYLSFKIRQSRIDFRD